MAAGRRGRSDKQRADELYFPIRLRVELPQERDSRYMTRVYDWLNRRARHAHALHPAPMLGRGRLFEGIDIYLIDPALVQPMLAELGLQLAEGPEPELVTHRKARG